MENFGALYEESYIVNARGLRLFTCKWSPVVQETKGLVFLCHGYGMECSVYTRGTGLRLAQAGYEVFGIDYEGHGKSQGLQCYIPNFDDLVTDCTTFFYSVMDLEENAHKPRFLFGESMGGAVATLVSRRDQTRWNGLVLVAPMCKISEKIKPPAIVVRILVKLANFIPTWKVVASKDVIENAFKDPVKREQIRSNPFSYRGAPRLKTAIEMLRASTFIEEHLDEIASPFLCLHGGADVVTDPDVSRDLYNSSVSVDKTLKIYPGMWHGLTTGEPDENVDLVFGDIMAWLNERVAPFGHTCLSPKLESISINALRTDLKPVTFLGGKYQDVIQREQDFALFHERS